jgi:hypothetical protein
VRRRRRILLNAAAGLSLLLCLAAAGDWVNSYRYYWNIWHAARMAQRACFQTWAGSTSSEPTYPFPLRASTSTITANLRTLLANTLERDAGTTPQRWKPVRFIQQRMTQWRAVVIPHWVFATLFAIAPLLRFR